MAGLVLLSLVVAVEVGAAIMAEIVAIVVVADYCWDFVAESLVVVMVMAPAV